MNEGTTSEDQAGTVGAIAATQAAIVAEFQAIDDWKLRYRRIIEIGKAIPDLDEAKKTDDNKVKGCQSQVWLTADLRDGRVYFAADSDAAIVRGLVALVTRVYSGGTPNEILAAPPTFVDELGLGDNLSQSRSNGLSAMIKQIKFYAVAYKSLTDRMNA